MQNLTYENELRLAGLRALIEKAGLIDDPRFQNILRVVSVYPERTDIYERVAKHLFCLSAEQRALPDPFFPHPRPEQVCWGPIPLGYTADMHPVSLSTKQLNGGIFIAGAPGTIKTTTMRTIAIAVAGLGIKILWNDQKEDSPCLIREIPDFAYFDLSEFPWNPFEPDEYDDDGSWYLEIANIYRKCFGMFQAGEHTIFQDLVEVNRKIKERNKNDYASPIDLLTYVKEKSVPRNSEFARNRDREILRLGTICESYGQSARYSRGVKTSKKLSRNLGIGTHKYSPDLRGFNADSEFSKMIRHRMGKGEKHDDLVNLFIMDDAKVVMDKDKERISGQGVATMTQNLNLSRELGIGHAYSDHHPHKIQSGVFSVTRVKVLMPLGHGEDLRVMSQAMGLPRHFEEYSHTQRIGDAIVKVVGEEYSEPFLVTFPYMKFDSVTKEDVEKRQEKVKKYLMEGVKKRSDLIYRIMKEERTSAGPGSDGLAVLVNINDNPFQSLTEIYKSLGWTTNRGLKAIKHLENQGWINLSKAGKNVLTEPTTKSKIYMKNLGIQVKSFRKGNVLTNFYIEKMRVYFEQRGYKVKTEAKIGNYYTDLLLIGDDSERWAVEFALSPEYQVHNIKKLLHFGLSGITVVSNNSTVLSAIKKRAKREVPLGKLRDIRFVLVKDLLKSKRP